MAEIAQLPYDIIEPAMPPAPPPDFTWAFVIGAIVALTLIALALVYRRRTRRRRLARRQLELARRSFLAGTLPAYDAAYAIAEALRAGFGLGQISAAESGAARWQAFVAKLDRARYSANGADESVLADLFAEAAVWLRGKSPC